MSDIANKVETLMEAMPYLQKYQGKIIVIKYGGNAMINEELKDAVMHDVVLLKLLGMKPVLSHGGGPGINKMLEKLDIPVEFIDGLRYTSADIMRVVEMVLVGQVNTELVGFINKLGGKAVGLSGVSGDIYHCHQRDEVHGYVGDSESCRRKQEVINTEKDNTIIMGYLSTDKKKITTKTFAEMKAAGEKVTMLTAYDFTTAGILDAAGIDSILIGDSASNVMAGNADTLPITVDQMIYHARSVARACKHAFVVCDMPFGSYQISKEEALRNACRMMKETGVDALKLEGGIEIADTVKALVDAGIPVHGHLGLTPQSVNKFGGYGIRAKDEAEAQKLISDAIALDKAGVFAIVLEKVPAKLAAEVTRQVKAVTIGIGAGNGCDGQVLVYADALGMTQGFKPKFLRHFAQVGEEMQKGVKAYIDAVKSTEYPSIEESY